MYIFNRITVNPQLPKRIEKLGEISQEGMLDIFGLKQIRNYFCFIFWLFVNGLFLFV